MKRNDMAVIVKARSVWKIDKRRGNYTLPSGTHLIGYVEDLIRSQLKLDSLGIAADGNIYTMIGNFSWNKDEGDFYDATIMVPYGDNETVSYSEHEDRITRLAMDIVL